MYLFLILNLWKQGSNGDSDDIDWSDDEVRTCSSVSSVSVHIPVFTPPTCEGQNKYFETMNLLEDMGFQYDEAFTAINRCGLETPIEELVEFIDAAKMGKEDDLQDLQVELNDA
ncbi:hypothetical protein AG4045_000892, partial [Apium graveolens]